MEANDPEKSRQVTAIVLGCGQRGQIYSRYAVEYPHCLKIVAVADPLKHRRDKVAQMSGLTNPDFIVDDWAKLASMPGKIADCAFITTQDQMHKEPAVAFAAKGKYKATVLIDKNGLALKS